MVIFKLVLVSLLLLFKKKQGRAFELVKRKLLLLREQSRKALVKLLIGEDALLLVGYSYEFFHGTALLCRKNQIISPFIITAAGDEVIS